MTRPKRGSGYLDMAPERGSAEREYNGRIGDVVGESAESGARRDPCGKVVSGGDPLNKLEKPLHYSRRGSKRLKFTIPRQTGKRRRQIELWRK